nr:hypothetical protein [Kibdelosporangium sp. MJ126-NF4]CTQ96117.1 hypothetical protein [Kibdelosporangium sp. MJ126-NF4]
MALAALVVAIGVIVAAVFFALYLVLRVVALFFNSLATIPW